jgi:sulfate transport system ATP-binding protein
LLLDAALTGVVKRVHGLGSARRVEVQLSAPEALVEIDTPRSQALAVGDTIGLKPQRYRIFADAR